MIPMMLIRDSYYPIMYEDKEPPTVDMPNPGILGTQDAKDAVIQSLSERVKVQSDLLSKKAENRKSMPVATGVLDYFPDALLAVAQCSYVGNEQHNPGQPLHWDRSKSTDDADALILHLLDRGKVDSDGISHSAKVAWRSLSLLQREIEAAQTVEL